MFILRFVKEVLGLSSIMIIVLAAFFALVGFMLYLLHLPMEWTISAGFLIATPIAKYIDSKWQIPLPHSWNAPITFRRGAIAIGLVLIWLLTMIVAINRLESESKSCVG